MDADDDRIFFKGVGRAAGNVADKFFLADGRGVVKAFGDKNFLAANIGRNIRRNRINNHVKNFLRVELQAAAIIISKALAVANVVDNIFGRGATIEQSICKRNFSEGRNFGEFAF